MPFNGSGVFSRVYNWVTEQASSPIEISKLDAQEADIATALSNCILRDGTGVPSANTDWNGKKITNLAAATNTGDALSRGAAAVVTALSITEGAVISGTYTPTVSGGTNVSASTAFLCQYMRVGAVVTVSGQANVTPTSGAGLTTNLTISLPIASGFTAARDCAGAGVHNGTRPVAISANPSTDDVGLSWTSDTGSSSSLFFSFTYLIK